MSECIQSAIKKELRKTTRRSHILYELSHTSDDLTERDVLQRLFSRGKVVSDTKMYLVQGTMSRLIRCNFVRVTGSRFCDVSRCDVRTVQINRTGLSKSLCDNPDYCKYLVETIAENVDNDDLSNKDFRDFVRNSVK